MLFALGRVVATPAALEAARKHNLNLTNLLDRHTSGDWGVCCDEDKQQNVEALKRRLRILSAYPLDPSKESKGYGENTIWIITEADRSVTTFLLPEDY